MRRAYLAFDFGENALALLHRGEFGPALGLPKASEAAIRSKHYVELALWWQESATTAFLEAKVRFHGKVKSIKSSDVEKIADWLAFSAQLNQEQAKALADAF